MSKEQLEELDIDANVDETVEGNDEDYFVGLTDEEIAAINSDDGEEELAASADSSDDANGTEANDGNQPGADSNSGGGDTGSDDWEQEAQTVADRRAAIDTDFEAKLAELAELGQKYDDGDIYDGAYNAEKARIERELKRIEVREAELVTKEDAIATRENQTREAQQTEFATAVSGFMAKPENSVFVEGSAEFAALDQQLGVIASNMPPGTPFDVLLDKARAAVGSYLDLPQPGKQDKQESNKQTMPSISGMPSVVPNANDNSKYAHLDKLSGPELERAIADMSEEQQIAYLTQG